MRRLADEHRLGREKDLQLELCWLDQLQTNKFGGSRPRSVRNLFCFGTVLLLKGELPEVVAFSCCALYVCLQFLCCLLFSCFPHSGGHVHLNQLHSLLLTGQEMFPFSSGLGAARHLLEHEGWELGTGDIWGTVG